MNKQTEEALNMIDTLLSELKQGADEWTLLSHKGNHPENCWVGRVLMACKAALEQPCRECENLKHDLDSYMKMAHFYDNQKPLSDDEIEQLMAQHIEIYQEGLEISVHGCVNFARAIEDKLMEINK